jgi:shikimate kinase
VVVGLMGAGKSTVAKLLATQLGWDVVDTDEIVEQQVGVTVAEMFDAEGEGAFREAESEAISALSSRARPFVASLGGGAVVRPQNRAAARRLGTVVWLRARPETLAARVGNGEGRPLLAARAGGAGPYERLARLAAERGPLYEQVADVVVDVDELSAAEVATQVRRVLEGRGWGAASPSG